MGQQSSLCYNSAEITMHGLCEKERVSTAEAFQFTSVHARSSSDALLRNHASMVVNASFAFLYLCQFAVEEES